MWVSNWWPPQNNHFCGERLGDAGVRKKQPFSVTNKMCISTIAWVETSRKCSQHRPVPLTLSRDRAAWPGRGGWVQGPGEMPWSLVTMRSAASPAPSHGHRQVQGECEHPPKILVPKETRLLSPTRVRLPPTPVLGFMSVLPRGSHNTVEVTCPLHRWSNSSGAARPQPSPAGLCNSEPECSPA